MGKINNQGDLKVPFRKLSRTLKVGIILLGIAVGSFCITLILPKGGLSYLLTSNKPEINITKAHLSATASAQNITPVIKKLVEIPKQFQGTTIYEAKLKPTEKVIALTFDDG